MKNYEYEKTRRELDAISKKRDKHALILFIGVVVAIYIFAIANIRGAI